MMNPAPIKQKVGQKEMRQGWNLTICWPLLYCHVKIGTDLHPLKVGVIEEA